MSEQIITNQGQNQLFVNTDRGKIFVWGNRYTYKETDVANNTYDPIEIKAGTVYGQINASGKVKKTASASSDGSQYPFGVLAQDLVIEAGKTGTVKVAVCQMGDVVKDKVIFDGSDTFATVVDGRTMEAHLNTMGIKLLDSTDLTGYDNS